MDYKYIEQLLERYWQCETTLEEEKILRTFFSQKDVPVSLLPYKDLFTYAQQEQEETLDQAFDARILEHIGEPTTVKAKSIKLSQRLKPLFKAAAVIAIILTLGNAVEMAIRPDSNSDMTEMTQVKKTVDGPSVAKADTAITDTMGLIRVAPVIKK